jgi:DNA repair exonuclease SbcCD ATPase subunit
MRFDIIDKLGDMANQSLTKYKDIREHISKKIDNDFIVNTKKAKQKAEILLQLHTENKAYAKLKIKTLHEKILETSSKLNSDCTNFLKANSYNDTKSMLECLNLQLDTNKNESEKIFNVFYGKTMGSDELGSGGDGSFNDSGSGSESVADSVSDFNLDILKESILDTETKNNEIIKDALKKQKQIDHKNEKLYKSHKPCNIKIDDDLVKSPLDYLNNLKDTNAKKIESHKTENAKLDEKIALLKLKENQIEINNDKILSLEKQMIKLPDSLLELVTDSVDNLYDEYKSSLSKMIVSVSVSVGAGTSVGAGVSVVDTLIKSKPYKEYETSAKQYFISSEISKYKIENDSNEELILEQQNTLEQENNNIKNEMKNIRMLESQIRQIESKIASLVNQNQQIDNDIDNFDNNQKIDEEIEANKQKKNKYELRIEKTEANNKLLREKTKLIYKYEQLQNEKTHLNKELLSIYDVLNQFEKYKTLIEDNLKIQKELDGLRAELIDFEEIMEEVEKQYNIENTNLTKNTALIDQLRKDIAENKAIENNLTLYTIYRKALKQLPYLLLSKIQPVLEKKVNDLLSIITDFTLKFDMSDSKIDIYIDRSINRNDDNTSLGKYSGSKYSGGNKLDRHILVNNASGFERFISSLAIRIALLDISNLPKINFMAIDEGWSCFDTTNLNNVGQILDYLKTKFDYILTISHLTEIKQYCDTMITLRKDEKGFSKIII